jgi:hypothetical protein
MANNITTYNVSPYYDDFSPDKNYHRILFRPGYAVQARELTQLQTILQDQVSKFGQHVFKDGSRVLDGQLFYETNVYGVRLNSTFGGNTVGSTTAANTVNVNLFANSIVTGITSGARMRVKLIQPSTAVGEPTIAISSLIRGGTGSYLIANNEVLRFNDAATNTVIGYANSARSGAVTQATLVHVDKGVYFVRGHLVQNPAQTIAVSNTSGSPNATVGFIYAEDIVTAADDTELLDPAQGSYNYSAPGADRYRIRLTLHKVDLGRNGLTSNNLPTNYFELIRLVEGTPRVPINQPAYATLLDVMAKRTYEESGDYEIRPFKAAVSINGSEAANLFLTLTPGKAIVRGYPVEYLTSSKVVVSKGRDTESQTGYDVGTYYGNYLKVTALANGSFAFSNTGAVELHKVSNRGALSAATKIGTAHTSAFIYDSGSGNTAVHLLALHNIQMSGNNRSANVRSVIAGTHSNVQAFANIASVGVYSNGSTQIFDPLYSSYVFELPHDYIKTITSSEYEVRRVFKNISFVSGQATILTDNGNERFLGATSGVVPSGIVARYYTVITKSASGTFAKGKHIPLDSGSRTVTIASVSAGSPGQATINLNDGTFNGTCDIIAGIDVENDASLRPGIRTKTRVLNSTKVFRNIAANTNYSLLKSDLDRIIAVYWAGSNTKIPTSTTNNVSNILNRFVVDTGQKDTYYDHASLRLKVGATAPNGYINVVFNYYTHSGKGALTVNSYPVSYANIGSYTTSQGTVVRLADAYDFRARRTDNSANSTLTFDTSVQLPDYSQSINSDYSYYLSRADKLVLTKTGQFVVLPGISSYDNALAPADVEDAMTIASIKVAPYTFDARGVSLVYSDNRRFTMRDIGKIEKRVGRIEYYTALSLLEKDVKELDLKDSQGNTLFKNGILVDNFKGSNVADVTNPDYKASIDFDENYGRPPFTQNAIDFNLGTQTNVTKKGSLITLPYVEEVVFRQDLASDLEYINPFEIGNWVGKLTLSPDRDFWYDTVAAPILVTNPDGINDCYLPGAIDDRVSTAVEKNRWLIGRWNVWNSTWFNYDYFKSSGLITEEVYPGSGGGQGSAGISRIFDPDKIKRFRISGTIGSPGGGTGGGDVIPFARAISIKFDVEGMRPNTEIFCWFDGRFYSPQIRVGSATANIGLGRLYTDKHGRANGYIEIPNPSTNSFYRVPAGTKLVLFSDDPYTPRFSTTWAQATFTSEGRVKPVTPPPSDPPVYDPTPIYCDDTPITITPITQNYFVDSSRSLADFIAEVEAKTGQPINALDPSLSKEEAAAQLTGSLNDIYSNLLVNPNDTIDTAREQLAAENNSETNLDFSGAVYWVSQYIDTAGGYGFDQIENSITVASTERAALVAEDPTWTDPSFGT